MQMRKWPEEDQTSWAAKSGSPN